MLRAITARVGDSKAALEPSIAAIMAKFSVLRCRWYRLACRRGDSKPQVFGDELLGQYPDV